MNKVIYMRAYWKGPITFGLVHIPVKLYKARSEHTLHFRLLCPIHKKPLNSKLWCPEGHEVSRNEAIRAFEYEKGKFIEISDEDLEKIPVESAKAIKIFQFANMAELDPIYIKDLFYVLPEPGAERAYFLLKEAMEEEGKIAIGKITIRGKERPVAIIPRKNGLLLATLYYADEVKPIEVPVTLDFPSDEEVKLARELVKSMSKPLKLEELRDVSYEAFKELVRAKLEGRIIEIKTQPSEQAKSLMEALKASLKGVKEE